MATSVPPLLMRTFVNAIPVADATPGTLEAVDTAASGTGAPWLWFWMIRFDVDALVDRAQERLLEAVDQHREEHDQADADHERRGGHGRAARVAGGVLARQPSRRAAAQPERPADDPGERADQVARQPRQAEERQDRADGDGRQALCGRRAAPVTPRKTARMPSQQPQAAEIRREAGKPRRWQHGTLAQRGDRRHACGAAGRHDGRRQRDADADDERQGDAGPQVHADGGERQPESDRLEQRPRAASRTRRPRQGRAARRSPPPRAPRRGRSGAPAGASRRSCAAWRTRACAGRP